MVGGGGYFDGTIDEARIYNRALSADEIGELYRAGARRMKTNTTQVNKLTDGLVGHWTFNGEDMDWGSNTAYDRSGQGNNGVITNMSTSTSPVSGISGQALEFDGTDDFVEITDAAPNGNSQRTITLWFNADSFWTSSEDYMFAYDYDSNDFGICAEDNAVSIDFYSHRVITPKDALSINTWYFVAAVVPPGATQTDDVIVYIDGSLQSLSDEAGSNFTLNTGPTNVAIGARAYLGVGYSHFNGIIDEARIYNRALSADEIEELYRAGARRVRF